MSEWTTVRISKASLARLKARGEALGLSATDCLHRLIEAPEPGPTEPTYESTYRHVPTYQVERDTRGPDPERMTPGERARWERKRGAA